MDALPRSDGAPEGFGRLLLLSIRRKSVPDRLAHMAVMHGWGSHCGEEAYLWFFDQQTSAAFSFPLPDAHRYRLEAIDVWAMTRTVLCEAAGGKTTVKLPGREGIAVLALKME